MRVASNAPCKYEPMKPREYDQLSAHVDAHFPSKDTTITLRQLWGEPMVIPEAEK